MYLYSAYARPVSQLGQPPPVSQVVGNQQQLTGDAVKALMTLFTNRYPVLTSSFSMGAAVPGYDPNADLWSYIASSAAPPAGTVAQTVYDQLQAPTAAGTPLASSGLVLVDKASAQSAIYGAPADVVYAIAKNAQVAALWSSPTSSFAVLGPAAAPAAQPPAKPAPKPAAPSAVPIVAGIGLVALIAAIAATA